MNDVEAETPHSTRPRKHLLTNKRMGSNPTHFSYSQKWATSWKKNVSTHVLWPPEKWKLLRHLLYTRMTAREQEMLTVHLTWLTKPDWAPSWLCPRETCLSLPCVLWEAGLNAVKCVEPVFYELPPQFGGWKQAEGSGISDPSSASWQIPRFRQECCQCYKSHVNRNRGGGGGADMGGRNKRYLRGACLNRNQREVSAGWPAATNPESSSYHSYMKEELSSVSSNWAPEPLP